MMANWSALLINGAYILGTVTLATVLICIGYMLGRNSADKPVKATVMQRANKVPYHDQDMDPINDAMRDPNKDGIPTL